MAAQDNEHSTKAGAPKKERIAFWMDSDLAEKVRALAFEQKTSNSHIVSELVKAAPEPTVKRG